MNSPGVCLRGVPLQSTSEHNKRIYQNLLQFSTFSVLVPGLMVSHTSSVGLDDIGVGSGRGGGGELWGL